MKIAIATDWFAPRRGGIESQLGRLATELGRRGHEVDVITSQPGARPGGEFRLKALRPLPGLALALTPTLPRALRAELQGGYDVVHAHISVVSPVGYGAALVARSLGIPVVVTFHSVLKASAYFLKAATTVAAPSARDDAATHWTGVSTLVATQLRRALGDAASIGVLPNGIDVDFWRGAGVVRRTSSECRLVFAGRLHRKKRPRELVQAFARATRASAVPATLVLVGEGPERAALERDIRALDANGGARVELRGWLAPGDLRDLYAGADAFVTAAVRESFGIAALEARAAGLPVIAMRDAGSTEFLADDGALLCADDSDIARQLHRFLQDDALRSRLRSAPVTLERYGWDAVLRQHETAYAAVMMRGGRASEAVVA